MIFNLKPYNLSNFIFINVGNSLLHHNNRSFCTVDIFPVVFLVVSFVWIGDRCLCNFRQVTFILSPLIMVNGILFTHKSYSKNLYLMKKQTYCLLLGRLTFIDPFRVIVLTGGENIKVGDNSRGSQVCC